MYFKTSLDLWARAMGYSKQLKSGNYTTISNQTPAHYTQRTVVCAQNEIHEHAEMQTVKDSIRHLSLRYRDRIEKHENVLAQNLLTEAQTARRLKRQRTFDLVKP